MIWGHDFQYWAGLLGAVIYAATKSAENEPLLRRSAKIGASALLAYGLTSTVAAYLWHNEVLAAIAVMVFGQMILDLGTAILLDKKINEAIKQRLRDRVSGEDHD